MIERPEYWLFYIPWMVLFFVAVLAQPKPVHSALLLLCGGIVAIHFNYPIALLVYQLGVDSLDGEEPVTLALLVGLVATHLGFVLTAISCGLLTRAAIDYGSKRDWKTISKAIVISFGLLAFAAITIGPDFLYWWVERRPPPAACRIQALPVRLAGLQIAVPGNSLFGLQSSSDDSEYFSAGDPKDQRALCSATDNGTRELEAMSLDATFFLFASDLKHSTCCQEIPAWASQICSALGKEMDVAGDFPSRMSLFIPEAIRNEDRDLLLSTHAKVADGVFTNPRAGKPWVIKTAADVSKDGNPITFLCEEPRQKVEQGDPTLYCQVAYGRGDGTHMHFQFNAPEDSIVTRGIQIMHNVEELIDNLKLLRKQND